MSLTTAQRVRLGTFVFTGLAVAAGSVAFVAGIQLLQEQDVYTLIYRGNVAGLELGSSVRYQGLRVGSVSDMKVAPEDVSAIEVELSLEPGTELHEGTEAVLELSGITGLKTVNLVPGDPRHPRLEPGSRIPPGASFVQRISGDAEAIAEKVERIADNLTGFVSPENRRRVERLLDNVNQLVEDTDLALNELRDPSVKLVESLTTTSDSLGKTSDSVRERLRKLEPPVVKTLAALQSILSDIGPIVAAVDPEKVEGAVDATHGLITRFEKEFEKVDLGIALADMERALVRLTDLLDDLDLVVRSGRQDFILSLKAIRETSEELREFSRLIAQDPSVLLRGTNTRQ